MNKRSYIFTAILLPLALIGLMLIQIHWVRKSIESKEEAFTHTMVQVLNSVSDAVEQNEMNKYVNKFMELKSKDSLGNLTSGEIRDFVFVQEDKNTKETFVYKHNLIQENYKVPSELFNIPGGDSTQIKNYLSRQTSRSFAGDRNLNDKPWKNNSKVEKVKRFSSFDKAMFEEVFKEVAVKLPIMNRTTQAQIELLLSQELKNRGIDLDFEYAICDKSKTNKDNECVEIARSNNFNKDSKLYKTPLFKNDGESTNYELVVEFPGKGQYMMSGILTATILAILFMVTILGVFIKTFLMLSTQKQISQMKTDFINNMTHEFKTPIATIKLALDAMKNPMVRENEEKMNFYIKMLADENKRMHAQVENILQISQLDKNQMALDKEPLDLHEIIENAIAHTQLLLDDRKGVLRKQLNAENSDILASEVHFTNVIVNILENAIKYSDKAPQIDISTQTINNTILVKIKDQGIGMSKGVVKKIFERFYRENTGDIHNIKGHGLGLAYVKRIVKAHNGEIYVESEKGKGSTFFIKMPLIV